MSETPELTLIKNEIERLEAASGQGSLTLEDVRKLEILIKTRKLVLGEPTEITETKDSKPKKKVSDAEVLKTLKPKPKTKRKTRATNGKTTKTKA